MMDRRTSGLGSHYLGDLMEHPFISDLSDKTLEDLQSKITELNGKLSFAFKTGNRALIHQLTLAIESYRSAYNKKMDELIKNQKLNTTINVQKK